MLKLHMKHPNGICFELEDWQKANEQQPEKKHTQLE